MISRPVVRLMLSCSALVALVVLGTAPASAASLSFHITIPEDRALVTVDPAGDRVDMAGTGWDVPKDPGAASLPYRIVRIVLPQRETVDTFDFSLGDATVLRSRFRTTVTGALETSDGDPVTAPVSTDALSPTARVEYIGTGTLQGYQIASFAVFPFAVRDGALYRVNDADIRITTRAVQSSIAEPIRHRDGRREDVRAQLAQIVINPGDLGSYIFRDVLVAHGEGGFAPTFFPSLEGSDVDYVIITNDSLAASYQILADWKTKKGVPTVVRTTEWITANYRNGSDQAETIRNFVIDAFSLWGVKYVLLGGDSDQIPVRYAFSTFYPVGIGKNVPVDMYFGCLDGDWNADHDAVFGEFPADNADLYSEVYVGRLPTRSNAEVALMVGKVENYERPLHLVYGKKILMLGEVLFPSDYHNGDPISLNGADIAEYVRLSTMTSPSLSIARNYETSSLIPGSVAESRQAAIDSINAGFNHVVHIGHGFRFNMSCADASLVNADADALTNGIRLANMNLLNCTACAFTYESLAEHFLRNPNGGAVSVVGSNDSAFPSTASEYMREFYRLVLTKNVTHLGEAFARSRVPRTDLAEGSDGGDRWTHYTYTLLGDPEMPLWTATTRTLAVAKPASVNKGTNLITLTVTSSGSPVDSAIVCLSKGDDDYEVGYTNASGQVTLSFRAESTGSIDVVATGTNCKRYEGTITVAGTGAYVAINTVTIDDDNAGGTSGNGNGVIESGETVDMALSLRNNGTATTGTVSVILRTSGAGVTVTDSTASDATIVAGGTKTMTNGCRVSFASSIADQYAAPFVLIIRNNGVDTWRDEFKKNVHRPKLDLVKLRVDDTVTGNGNGVVDAGEQFKLFYKAKNFGTGTYPGGTVTAFDLDGAFTITTGTSAYPTIVPQASAENTTGLTMTESSVATEHRLRLRIVDLYGRAYEDTVELRPPVPPTAIVIDASEGTDRLKLTWTGSVSTDAKYYTVYRSLNGGGPFTAVTTDAVRHSVYVNTGLSPTTRYYYKISTIDVSGNESAQSAAFSGSTNPAQLEGWPIAMETETTSSPAVGDIDGDGTLEIVVGDKWVYAWHANGDEMVDGDANPFTWGVLSNQGQSFVGHVALARIDFNPGLDIVAASRDTRQVFVFDHTGATLPGWPQPVENAIRAGVVVGDINNDNAFEIIAIDELGVLYVWKKDGTEYRDGDANPLTPGVFARLSGCSLDYSVPALADLSGDGKDDIIVGTQGNQLLAFKENGTSVTGFPVALTDDIAGSPAVGDVDGNGDLEIVVNIKDGNIRAINHDGTNLWTRFITQNLYFFGPSPALGDVNGDGKLEAFVPTYNGKLYAITYTGGDLPGFPVTYSAATYTESSPVIADINGDGLRDVLLGSEEKNIWAWDRNGVALDGFPLTTQDAMRGVPTVADVDGNGKVNLVAAGWDKGVYIWDFNGTWNAANAPWPRFHANLHNNGRLGFTVPTAVGGTRFEFTAMRDGGLELEWEVAGEAGRVFEVERADWVDGSAGRFQPVARGVGASVDGVVRVVDRGVEMGSRYVYRLSGETGVVHETAGLYVPVTRAALGQNYPNPFNPVTKIEYWVPEGTRAGAKAGVSLVVYDVRGAKVRTLVTSPQGAGRYVVEWDGRDESGGPVSSGVYFYRMSTRGFADTRKMLLLK